MAEQIESNTWTAYLTLLSTLPDDESRANLETAACAHYCGRYEDAERAFQRLPSASQLYPIVVFQRADMLSLQGRERERLRLLERASHQVLPGHLWTEPAQNLHKLMLADAEFWVHGRAKEACDVLAATKEHFRSMRMIEMSDIEVFP